MIYILELINNILSYSCVNILNFYVLSRGSFADMEVVEDEKNKPQFNSKRIKLSLAIASPMAHSRISVSPCD